LAKQKKVAVRASANRALREDKQLRQQNPPSTRTLDSFQNFAAKLGMGTDNLMAQSTYGFNPISRIRQLLEWIHRGSWIGGMAVDIIAEDMTREGYEITGDLTPDEIQAIEAEVVRLNIMQQVCDGLKWERLYGGSVLLHLVEGQLVKDPLRLETVGKGSYRGMLVLDRWMVEPNLSDLVTELGPALGLPRTYRIVADSPAFRNQRFHYSRAIRFDGIRLPYWQRLQENLWGLSEIERLYDRMVAFDSTTTGGAQLVFKAFLRTYKIKELREVISAGGDAMAGLAATVDMMRRFQSSEGMTLIDAEDEYVESGASNFSGVAEILQASAEQVSGALGVPLVRLLGQSPAGLNSTGESDLRMYFNSIKQRQSNKVVTPLTFTYKMVARSLGILVPPNFALVPRPLWQLSDVEKADVAQKNTATVLSGFEGGIITKPSLILKELKQQSKQTGVWTNITDDDIEEADLLLNAPGPEEVDPLTGEPVAGVAGPGVGEEEPGLPAAAAARPSGVTAPRTAPLPSEVHRHVQVPDGPGPHHLRVLDSVSKVGAFQQLHGLHVVVENPAGSLRRGRGDRPETSWEVRMPADYGYVRGTTGADGDQVDCFLGSNPRSQKVWIIDQRDLQSGLFDEHKCMLGYDSAADAMKDYEQAYHDGRSEDRIMGVRRVSMLQFHDWLQTGDKRQPFNQL
jgi:phage-related protein (TIGR01555 family)